MVFINFTSLLSKFHAKLIYFSNIKLISLILAFLKKDTSLIKFVKDRKGHDERYALNTDKLYKEIGVHFADKNFLIDLSSYIQDFK